MRLSLAACLSIILSLISMATAPQALSAQPFGTPGAFLDIPDADGYVEVPNDPSLTPKQAITIEFWGSTATQTGINSFIGKGSLSSYWIGSDHGKLRSILQGTGTSAIGGVLPNDFAHIAVTYDGHHRRHYIDGELVAVFPQTGALVGNAKPLRLGSDIDFPNHPFNDIFEVRLWSVARTQDQIRAFSTQRISKAMPGLVAVWHLDSNGNDAVGGHNGGPPQGFAQYVTLGTGPCGPQTDRACFMNRFQGQVAWEVFSLPATDGHLSLVNSGAGMVVPGASSNSALFYFFDPSNWELLVKMPASTCALGDYWVFSAATTNVHYTLVVYDLTTGTMKRYFNYSGPPAPAVTDTAAFATCP